MSIDRGAPRAESGVAPIDHSNPISHFSVGGREGRPQADSRFSAKAKRGLPRRSIILQGESVLVQQA